MSIDIVWLRNDFRLDDQPAIAAAADRPALFVHVHDERPANGRPPGGAAKWRLAQALRAFEARLAARGGRLDIVAGEASETILRVAAASGAARMLWTRRYEGEAIRLDSEVKAALKRRGLEALSFAGRLMREPWELAKDGRPPLTFSAFWRRHQGLGALSAPLPAPKRLTSAPWPDGAPERTSIAALGLIPTNPDWSGELAEGETPGEAGAQAALSRFLTDELAGCPDARDLMGRDATSRLSAHLAFGEISAGRVAEAVERAAAENPRLTRAAEKYRAELGWRDFAAALLLAHPDMATKPLREDFARFPWREDKTGFRAWSMGLTGYPIVDAGMRQLWRTGYMHNRVRMIVASFLAKHLLIDWRRGEQGFWDRLCDADPASNPMNWQWVAGSGADAAPYFRIFNPVLQAEKYDADGAYTRRWVPELASLAPPHIHAPSDAPHEALRKAGVVPGETYPRPIVAHTAARARALAAFVEMRASAQPVP
jgi:deoxyribodipyrimidine photo-lyase